MADRSFEFLMEGQYYGVHTTTGAPTVKQYKAKFLLPSIEAAQSKICKYLLDPYLRKNYEDYAKFRTHKISSVKVNGKTPDKSILQMAIEDMNKSELADLCIIRQIFIDPYTHKDLNECRREVRVILEARVAQAKADQKSGASAEKTEIDELLRLNGLSEAKEFNENELRVMAGAASDPKKMDVPLGKTVSVEPPLNKPVKKVKISVIGKGGEVAQEDMELPDNKEIDPLVDDTPLTPAGDEDLLT